MREIENKKIVREYETIVSITCDICKRKYNGGDWGRGAYDALEVTVEMKTGRNYPDNGSGEITFFDICPDCFENKLTPALKELGAHPSVEEWDW